MGLEAEQAVQSILTGKAPDGMTVDGDLDLQGVTRPFRLPRGLRVHGNLRLSRSVVTELPDGLTVRGGIAAVRCPSLARVGRKVRATLLEVKHCVALDRITEPIAIPIVFLDGCTSLTRLPDVVKCTRLSLKGCIALQALPAKLRVDWLNLEGCRSLQTAPEALRGVEVVSVDETTPLPYDWRRFDVDGYRANDWIVSGRASTGLQTTRLACPQHTWLRQLPEALIVRGDATLEGCENLAALPAHLSVTGTLTLTGCKSLGELPSGLRAGKLVLPDGSLGKARPPGSSLWQLFKSVRVAFQMFRQFSSMKIKTTSQGVSAVDARRAITAGETDVVVREDLTLSGLPDLEKLPNRLWVFGNLVLADLDRLRELPRDLRVTGQMRIQRCAALAKLPQLAVDMLEITRCPALEALPRITCGTLTVTHCDALREIPNQIAVDERLTVTECANLARVSDRVHAQAISLGSLPKLDRIPNSPATAEYFLAHLPQVTAVAHHNGVRALMLKDLPQLRELPDGLELASLDINGCPLLSHLPARLCVTRDLALYNCPGIRVIPRDTRTIAFRGERLPALEAIEASWTDLREMRVDDCPRIRSLPASLRTVRDYLVLVRCTSLTSLPEGLQVRGKLSLENCPALRALPAKMPPPESVEMAGAGLEALPAGWSGVQLTWNGVVMSERQLFPPASVTPEEVIGERNVAVRRVMILRYGLGRLMSMTGATTVDEDTDRAGPRRLIRIPVEGDEPILMLQVQCPSTSRQFHLRVDPHMTSCRQAAAWLAGFWNPDDYNPIVET